MIEDIRLLGTVEIADIGKLSMMNRGEWLKLSEDIGGLTLVGTFVRTSSLTEVKEEPKNA